MQPTAGSQLAHGVYAALATPLRKSAIEPDTAAFLDYVDVVARTGVNGLVLFGATGEFIHFDAASRAHTLNLVLKRSRLPVLVNVSHSTLGGALELAEDAIDAGASGVLVMAPYFYRYADDDLEEFFQVFARGIDRGAPIYLYNLPQFGNGLSVALATRLLDSGMFAGIKDSSRDWDLFQALRSLRDHRDFRLLAGNERIYLRQQFAGGVDGIVSGVSAALPELVLAITRAVFAQDAKLAERLDGQLQHFLDRIEQFPTPLGIKQTAAARGWLAGNFAMPLSREAAARLEQFSDWLKEWIPHVLNDCKVR
ncbi:MAG TPA: dihydrodipicolinate synthase family protein [Bryobacteraceae bacterium]|nr:dihydrodipicolinate synthase family protein [Bryobacteraceae bacterium]